MPASPQFLRTLLLTWHLRSCALVAAAQAWLPRPTVWSDRVQLRSKFLPGGGKPSGVRVAVTHRVIGWGWEGKPLCWLAHHTGSLCSEETPRAALSPSVWSGPHRVGSGSPCSLCLLDTGSARKAWMASLLSGQGLVSPRRETEACPGRLRPLLPGPRSFLVLKHLSHLLPEEGPTLWPLRP